MRIVLPFLSFSHNGLLIIPPHLTTSSLLHSKIADLNRELMISIKLNDDGIIIASDLSVKHAAGVVKEVLKRKLVAIRGLFKSFKSSRDPTFKIIDYAHSSDPPLIDHVYPFLRKKALSVSMLILRASDYTPEVLHSTTHILEHNGTIELMNEKFANASRDKRTVLAEFHTINSDKVASFETAITKSLALNKSRDNKIIEVIANISKVVQTTYNEVKDRKQTDTKIILETLNARQVRQEASSVISISGELSDPIILAAFLPSVILILALGIISLAKTLAKAREGALLLFGKDGQRFYTNYSISVLMNTRLRLITLSYTFMVLA
jgi:hypothetical protein